jgi:rubrerythrin
MSAVVYARLPDALKQTLQAFASERALTQNGAVIELLEQGLQALAKQQSLADLQHQLALQTNKLATTRARLREAELNLRAARQREQLTARTYSAVAQRARRQLASCPQCRTRLHGNDLFVSGHCPTCNKPLSSLLTPSPRAGGPDKDQYHALLGALGVLLGLALTSNADNTG